MIEVRNGRVYFFNPIKPDMSVQDFQCLSAYVCPFCKNVLKAYYVGRFIPESLKEYMEKDTLKYAYEFGDCEGGQWLAMQQHVHNQICGWQPVSFNSRGIRTSVESFLEMHATKVKEIEKFIAAVSLGKMPGFTVINDVTGTDLPMLLYKESDLMSLKNLDFDRKWELLKDIGKLIDLRLETIKC